MFSVPITVCLCFLSGVICVVSPSEQVDFISSSSSPISSSDSELDLLDEVVILRLLECLSVAPAPPLLLPCASPSVSLQDTMFRALEELSVEVICGEGKDVVLLLFRTGDVHLLALLSGG